MGAYWCKYNNYEIQTSIKRSGKNVNEWPEKIKSFIFPNTIEPHVNPKILKVFISMQIQMYLACGTSSWDLKTLVNKITSLSILSG